MTGATWPLTGPAAAVLTSLPGTGEAPKPLATHDAAPVRLALQELLSRGALTLDVVREGVWLTEATLGPGADPGELAPTLAGLYRTLRPLVPGPLKQVLPKAQRRNPVLTTEVRRGARQELEEAGLIEQRSVRRLGRRAQPGWVRTAAGDSLVPAAEEFVARLREATAEVDRDSEGGIEALFAADVAPAPGHEEFDLEGANRHRPGDAFGVS